MSWVRIPLPAPIIQETTERWSFCVIRRGGKRTHEKVPEEQKQPQNVVFGRRAKVAFEQAGIGDALAKKLQPSDRSLNLLLKNNESKFKQDDHQQKAHGSVPVGIADERSGDEVNAVFFAIEIQIRLTQTKRLKQRI